VTCSAVLPATIEVEGKYYVAIVSTTVTSQTADLPKAQGICVSPSDTDTLGLLV